MMQQQSYRTRETQATRPANVPADWHVWTAPRPLTKPETAIGWYDSAQLEGYVVALNPACEYTAGIERGMINSDAARVQYGTQQPTPRAMLTEYNQIMRQGPETPAEEQRLCDLEIALADALSVTRLYIYNHSHQLALMSWLDEAAS